MDPNAFVEIIGRYADAAKDHGDATEAGDWRKANKAHDRIYACLRELRTRTDGDVRALEGLCSHETPSVRGWAATHLLYFEDAAKTSVLEHVAQMHGPIGFSARMVLEEWAKGSLRIPID